MIDIDNEWVTVTQALSQEAIPLISLLMPMASAASALATVVASETVEDGLKQITREKQSARRPGGLEAAHLADEVVMGVITAR